MIALDRNLPRTCFECPCLATFAIDKENIPNVQYLIRNCEAAKQEMVVIEWDKTESVPDVWMNWTKPKWCPWKEIKEENSNDDDSYWHMSMAGLGGSYEY